MMIETPTPEKVPQDTGQPRLLINALCSHGGRVMIAVSDEHLVPITEIGDVKHGPNAETELLARTETEAWTDRMTRVRASMARDLVNERAELERLRAWVENLGDAILEKAVKHEWCGEYDEFAKEWDLPTRNQEYRVTVTVVLDAKSEDDARDYVLDHVDLDAYEGPLKGDPEVYVEEY